MAKEKNARELVQERMNNLLDARNNELNELKQRENNAASRIMIAKSDMENAARNTDLVAYSEAKERKTSAENEVEMYKARYNQLKGSDFMTEDESDKTIRSLLSYEDNLAEEYQDNVNALLSKLKTIHEAYRAEVAVTEQTIKEWTSRIYPNYQKVVSHYAGTNEPVYKRMETSQPVHPSKYLGCNVSFTINSLFNERNIKELFEAE